jgi:hypothetical protein
MKPLILKAIMRFLVFSRYASKARGSDHETSTKSSTDRESPLPLVHAALAGRTTKHPSNKGLQAHRINLYYS